MAGAVEELLGIFPVSADASATTGVEEARAAKEVPRGRRKSPKEWGSCKISLTGQRRCWRGCVDSRKATSLRFNGCWRM